jgi:glycerophosphoryl diester phosphodiesterase
MVTITAHRGFRIGGDENTIAAFTRAARLGVDFIEFDVQITADGDLIVIHDGSVNRTTTGQGDVAALSTATIRSLITKQEHQRIPLLAEVLDLIAQYPHLRPMIEIKAHGVPKPLATLLLDRHLETRAVVSGRYLADLQHFHAISPTTPLCLNISKSPDFPLAALKQAVKSRHLPLPLAMISLDQRQVSRRFIHACHSLGIQAVAWNFLPLRRPVDRIRKLVGWGIDGLLVDDPATLVPVRAKPS